MGRKTKDKGELKFNIMAASTFYMVSRHECCSKRMKYIQTAKITFFLRYAKGLIRRDRIISDVMRRELDIFSINVRIEDRRLQTVDHICGRRKTR